MKLKQTPSLKYLQTHKIFKYFPKLLPFHFQICLCSRLSENLHRVINCSRVDFRSDIQ